ncbi:MAG TPA: DUF5667 domain-containing protein [Anaerolineae bacterium]|nr:DUF5667 domain-containing protein [Anaerolineae bacterium]HQK13864.1 DUF5667 domain-containing protein [Anaerolineae bacterium]
MVALVKVLIAVALIFGMTAGTVSASQESLPGSVLYPVKVQYENVRLATTGDGSAKVLLALAYAQERVDEAVALVERGDEIPEPLTVRYQLQVKTALQTMESLDETQQLQLRTHISSTLQNQVRVMTQLMARLHQSNDPEHPEPTQARIQTMLKTMQQTQQHLGDSGPHRGDDETPGNVESPGPNPNDNGNGEDNGQQCFGDCQERYGETEDHDKQHENGEAEGNTPSDEGQNKNKQGGNIDNGSENGGNGGSDTGSGSGDTGGGTGNTGSGSGDTGGGAGNTGGGSGDTGGGTGNTGGGSGDTGGGAGNTGGGSGDTGGGAGNTGGTGGSEGGTGGNGGSGSGNGGGAGSGGGH